MPQYRKKPVVVEAIQWQASFGVWDLPDWLMRAVSGGTLRRNPEQREQLLIENKNAHMMIADPGDWIILEADGTMSRCKPGVFEQTYEPVDGFARRREWP